MNTYKHDEAERERNRIKLAKYRTRKQLKEAGYGKEEIDSLFASVEWETVTPADLLTQWTAHSDLGSTQTPRPLDAQELRSTRPRVNHTQPVRDEHEETSLLSSPWAIAGLCVLGIIGGVLAGILQKDA